VNWAARINLDDALGLGLMRLWPDVEVCQEGSHVWLRGKNYDDDVDLALRKLPGAVRFTLPDGTGLLGVGKRVPTGTIPAGPWTLLREFLVLDAQPAALAGKTPEKLPLTLVRSAAGREPGALLASLDVWADYAASAPQIRLAHMTFAATSDGRAFIRGTPLPPIAGTYLAMHGAIALPCGYHWTPPVDADVLHACFGGDQADVVFLQPDAPPEIIHHGDFARATRSAARMTVREVHCD